MRQQHHTAHGRAGRHWPQVQRQGLTSRADVAQDAWRGEVEVEERGGVEIQEERVRLEDNTGNDSQQAGSMRRRQRTRVHLHTHHAAPRFAVAADKVCTALHVAQHWYVSRRHAAWPARRP